MQPKLTEVQAAEYIAAKPQTLRVWRARGTGPAYHKLSGKIRYAVEDLDDFIAKSRVVPGSKPRRGARGTRRGSR